MKQYRKNIYEENMKKIRASKVPYYEAGVSTVLFDIMVGDAEVGYKAGRAVYYATTGRFTVYHAGINKFMPVEDALKWVKDNQGDRQG